MSTPILATKLFIPPTGKSLVVRPRLLEKLDGILQPDYRLMFVSAPPGFGKTTLISTWVSSLKSTEHQPSPSVAWLSLDDRDNDPIIFWIYFISALQATQVGIGKKALTLLQADSPPNLEAILASLVNNLVMLSTPFILILDDYHLIRSAEIHKSLSFFIEHMPPQFHLVILSRTDPPLPLALLRGRGQLLELRMADLRFSNEEATIYLNEGMKLALLPEAVNLLNTKTEGWAAGLQMAALSMQGRQDTSQFIESFSASNRYILDYLVEEVLNRLTEDIQEFLLRTSILDRLNGPLCDAVTGRQDSRAMLNALERANLFILPLDSRREWFRYHHLFGELLRRRFLQTENEATIKTLQRRAVDWLNANGHFDLAVEYALNFADFELATHLMVTAGEQFFTGNLLNTFLNLAARLPDEQIARNLTLACMLAWAAHATGHPQRAEQYIHLVENQTGRTIDEFVGYPDDPSLTPQIKAALIELGAARARINVDRFEITRTFHLVEKLLPYLVSERDSEPCTFNKPSKLRGPMIFILGLAQKLHGDIALAAQTFIDGVAEGRRTQNFHILALSMGHLGETQVIQGRLHDAQRTFSEALDAPLETLQTSSFFGISRVGLGNLAYEWNDLEGAINYLEAGIEQGKLWSSWECLLPGYTGLARLHAARQDWNSAFNTLNELQTNTRENQGIIQASAESFRALLHLWNGNLEAASRWAEDFDPDLPRDYVLAREYDALVRCRIWTAQGEAEKAEKLLDQIIRDARQGGRNRPWLEAMCLRSLLFGATRRKGEALTTLQSALEAAEPEGYIRVFVDEGEPMAKLLAAAIQKGIHPKYASRLLAAFPDSSQLQLTKVDFLKHDLNLIEPLSGREIEILQLIEAGLTNKEIAQKLCISVRTVKFHTGNLFGKFGVKSRTESIAKARTLGFIFPPQK
jgi:LuxR family maltose regulon positive regulatory protein